MAPAFDPYYKWLGIPPAEQPPNHYRLLAINLFESDPDVIEAAADQRMVHLRSLQTGQYSELSQELLNKISTAKVCLLKPQKKAQYDQSLREQLAASGPGMAVPPPSSPNPLQPAFPAAEPPPRVDWSPGPLPMRSGPAGFKPKGRAAVAKPRSAGFLPWLIGAPVAVALIIAIAVVTNNDSNDNGGPSRAAPGKVASAADSGAEGPAGKDGKPTPPSKTPAVKSDTNAAPPPKRPGPSDASVAVLPSNVAANPPPPVVNPPDQKPPEKKPPAEKPPEKKPEKPAEKPPEKTPEKKPPDSQPAAKPPVEIRQPVPDQAAQQQALAELKDALKTDFALASTVEARLALAKKLSKLADETNNNPALRYVMVTQALEYAQKVNDPVLAIDVLAKLCNLYDVDSWDLRSKTLAHLAHNARTPDAHQLIAEKILPLVDSAVAEDRYDSALALAAIAVSMTSEKTDKLVDPVLRDKARAAHDRCRRLQHDAHEVAAAKEKLAANPDDPEANLLVGRFFCLEKEDWSAGLPYLARGSDEGLRDAAMRELVGPTEATAQLALADAWWDLAEKSGVRTGLLARPMLARARYWYTRAVPGLTGLMLEKAQRRLREEEQAAQDLAAAKGIFLDDLPEQNPSVGHGDLGKHGATGFPKDDGVAQVLVHGVAIKHALVTYPPKKGSARVDYAIDGKFRVFSGAVAIMDGAGNAQSPVIFRVLGDGKVLWFSRPMQHEGDGQEFKLRLPPLHTLQLEVQCSGENNRAWCVWINPTVSK